MMIVKEVVSFYVHNLSSICCIFLDATETFNRIEYTVNYCSVCYINAFQRTLLEVC
jgi:hypothetical protein